MQKGLVFNIQRYSIHDGPGIRTTVFLKGCNLRCFWCHNPESFIKKKELLLFHDKCIHCGQCYLVCTKKAFEIIDDKRVFHRDLCDACGKCSDACCAGALSISGEYRDSEQVFNEVIKDIDFYNVSGGGLTISGGEPLLQTDFVKELLEKCSAYGIHTAIETSMYADYTDITKILPYTQLVLSDIKAMDDEKHKKVTGVSNKKILDNIKAVSQEKVDMIIRIPVIPDTSDSEENILSTMRFVKDFPNLLHVELINFHKMAQKKYKSLGIEYKAYNLQLITEERMEQLRTAAREYGITVK